MFHLSPQLLIATTRALAGMCITGEPDEDTVTTGEFQNREASPNRDARFVQECGFWSHYDHRTRTSSWPIPHGLTTEGLAMFGMQHGVLHDTPLSGDIFLQYSPASKSFIHSGVIVEVLASFREGAEDPYFDVYTIEGDTDEMGRVRGGKTMRVRRRLSAMMGDCFFRWADMTPNFTRPAPRPALSGARAHGIVS